MLLLFICKVAMSFLDFFSDECTEKAAEECSEFRVDVPLSDKFDSKAFEYYCK